MHLKDYIHIYIYKQAVGESARQLVFAWKCLNDPILDQYLRTLSGTYVCVLLCMYVCIYICVCVYLYIYIYIYIYICLNDAFSDGYLRTLARR